MQNNRYPEGYLPKIAYHIANQNPDKLDYFTKRHEEIHGELTEEDMHKVINMVMELAS